MERLQPYTEYKESVHPWVGKIPTHWQEKRAKYLYKEIDERSKTGDEELLSVSHITGVTPRSQKNINMFLAESYIGSKLCHEGDLVINTMWAWMAALGVSKQTGIVSPSYGVYRPKSREIFNNEYIDHLLRTQSYAGEYLCRSTGIRASRLRLYPESFLQIPIIFPPFSEQELIVKFLRWKNYQIGQYIRGKRKEIDLLNEQKQVIIHQAVTRGLNPQITLKETGFQLIEKIPREWDIKKVRYLKSNKKNAISMGPFGSDIKVNNFVDEGIPVIQGSNLTSLKLNEDDFVFIKKEKAQELSFAIAYRGDIILTHRGTIGQVSLIPDDSKFQQYVISQSQMKVTFDEKIIFPDYVNYYLNSKLGQFALLLNKAQTSIPAIGRPVSSLKSLLIPIPKYSQQKQISKYLDIKMEYIDNTIFKINESIESLQEYRTRLITDVVTGKLDVRSIAATLPDIEDISLDIPTEEELEEEYIDEEE